MAESKEIPESSVNQQDKEIAAELTKLKGEVSTALTEIKEAFENIVPHIETVKDNLQYNRATGTTLNVEKESVEYLVRAKTYADEAIQSVRSEATKSAQQQMNMEALEEYMNELEKVVDETEAFVTQYEVAGEAFLKLHRDKDKQKECEKSNESVASSDPSISDFSLFDGSTNNAATSSPITKTPENK